MSDLTVMIVKLVIWMVIMIISKIMVMMTKMKIIMHGLVTLDDVDKNTTEN